MLYFTVPSRSCVVCGVALVLLALLVARPAPAQDVTAIDSLARAFKAKQQPPGLVIGLTGPTGKRIRSYGVAALNDSTRLKAKTRFEIGSVTKAFTALLLAEMARRSEVSLDDPIGRYLPDSVQAPAYDGQPIQLHHLATHTSGLPRLPANLNAFSNDPYADYGSPDLHAFLDGYELPRAPGATYAYSNLGAGLLGHLLARRADTSYAALLHRRVLQPLGLTDTYLPPPSDTTDAQLAQGYSLMGPAAYWHFEALAGAGALRSTPADLLHFLKAQLDPSSTPLEAVIRSTHTPRHRVSGQLTLALGWHISTLPDSTRLYWHNGGTGGFRSFVGFAPDAQQGLVVLANEALPLKPFNQFAFQLAQAMQK